MVLLTAITATILWCLTASATVDYTKAYSLPPTGNWDGNDGGWSTFAIRVGTPPQYFRVLPSTSGTEVWIPAPDECDQNAARCGAARGVEPFNAAPPGSSTTSGVPHGVNGSSIDIGSTCTLNRSPMCIDDDCVSIDGKCTQGPCAKRQCCGDPIGSCNSVCNGVGGICTGQYIGCPCSGPDYNAGVTATVSSAANPALAQGFIGNASSSWISVGTQELVREQYLGIEATAQKGTDTVGLGLDASAGLTLQSVNVAGTFTTPFYIGSVGLKANKTTNSSMLSQLYNQKMIPSLSYGYTAGALYQQPPILGSFTLGGYDSARIGPGGSKNLTSSLRANDSTIAVTITAISLANTLTGGITSLGTENNFTVSIDTTLPYTYLPTDICQAFESAFGLIWNASTQMYLVNDTTHQRLANLNPTLTFTLATNKPQPGTLNITLPYAAFDLGAAYPIASSGSNYFPIRRANSSSQYILGRAFMQEAYLFVDYETSQFTISQVAFPANGATNVITVNHSPSSPPPLGTSSQSSGLSKGAIAGTVIGISVALTVLVIMAYSIWRQKHPRRKVTELWRISGPSVDSSGSETEKGSCSRYTPPPAFQSFRADRNRASRGSQQQGQGSPTQQILTAPAAVFDPHHPSTPPYLNEDDPWKKCELEDPTSPAQPACHPAMSSVLESKPLPLTPYQRQELDGSPAAREMPTIFSNSVATLLDRQRRPSDPGRNIHVDSEIVVTEERRKRHEEQRGPLVKPRSPEGTHRHRHQSKGSESSSSSQQKRPKHIFELQDRTSGSAGAGPRPQEKDTQQVSSSSRQMAHKDRAAGRV